MWGVTAFALASPGTASAYEFEVRAKTIGQGAEMRSFRLLSGDLILRRSRFTQTLNLNIWDVLGKRVPRTLYNPQRSKGPRVYFTTYMRVDHDFGDYSTGTIDAGGLRHDAVDLIPELEVSSLGLDVLYAYAAVEGLFDGLLDVRLGRQLSVDSLDWFSMDGLWARVHTPWHVNAIAFGGLRVRDSSPLGSQVQEPDGTAGSECREFVEGSVWSPIDRPPGVDDDNPFENDFDLCPQRDELMPTFGGAVETSDLPVIARVSYRRTVSPTPGLIGDPNRQDPPDVGYYPNEQGQAPGWGVNEERLSVTARAPLSFSRSRGQATPYVATRYSLLHGLIDEAHAGVRLRYDIHSVEPEIYYQFPTFDGDSIFNVFSTEPTIDYRLTYGANLSDAGVKTYARGYVRQYSTEDAFQADGVDGMELSAGGQVGVRYRRPDRSAIRLDGYFEDGYGGRRLGGLLGLRWQLRDDLSAGTQLSLYQFESDSLDDFDGTSFGGVVGATYQIHRGIAVKVMAEENSNRFNESQFRLYAILDLAFNPQP